MGEDLLAKAYRQHGRRIFYLCLSRTSSQADAEDLTAETFLRLARQGGSIPEAALLPWLSRVAGNLCIDRARRAKRSVTVDPHDVTIAGLQDMRPSAEWFAEHADVWVALASLKPLHAQIVYLRAVEGRPFAEVARLVGKKTGAVTMTYHRALKRLGEILEEERYAG